MIPRIEAAEKLAGIEAAALGANAGFESPLDRQRVIDTLAARASGEDALPPPPASPADLAGMGIAFVTEEPSDG